MQVEHKTEKGTISFELLPIDSFDIKIRFKRFLTYRTSVSSHIELFDEGIFPIGLTSEVTEELLIDIGFWHTDYIEDGLGPTDNYVYKWDSFQSLIKFKNIQEPSVVLFKPNENES